MDHAYDGREQTLAKHFILKSYLATLTFKLLEGGHPSLAYVDGFSGPWESKTSDYSDTSFMIAIRVLKDAHRQFRDKGVPKEIRCFFVEENVKAYKQLKAAVMAHHEPAIGFHVVTYCGRFEDSIHQIMNFVGDSFALIFIDPTGWTGYSLDKISPILRHRPGEALVNFMFDFVNRFIGSADPMIVSTFDSIFGGPDWKDRLDKDLPPGRAAEKLFLEELRKAGRFKYVLSTHIDKPIANRPHFALAYGTHSSKGLKAFRQIEFAALRAHEKRRTEAKRAQKETRTGQGNLFTPSELPETSSLEEIVADNREKAKKWVAEYLRDRRQPQQFSRVCEAVLETFMLRETDVKDICVDLAKRGIIKAIWRDETPRKQKPHDHHLIELVVNEDQAKP